MTSSAFAALAASAVPIARGRVVADKRPIHGVRHPPSFHAATGLRCQSGHLCSSSSRRSPRSLAAQAAGAHRPRRSPLVTAGPQPDTEEEGSALDFPEVRAAFDTTAETANPKLFFFSFPYGTFPQSCAHGGLPLSFLLLFCRTHIVPPRHRSTSARFRAADRIFSQT